MGLALIQPEKKIQTPLEIVEILNQVCPEVWIFRIRGRAINAMPVKVELKIGAKPVRIKQYPLKLEDRKGIKEIIDNFLQFGLLTECES